MWNPKDGPFDFAKVFGGGRTEKDGGLKYDRLRVWRAINLLTPSLDLKSDDENQPTYLTPDKKLSELDLFSLLRDFYKNTDYDRSQKDPWDETIRSIATWRGVHSSLIVITPSEPIESTAILWSGMGSSFVTGFTPIPFGVSQIPSSYSSGGEGSAFYKFAELATYSSNDWENIYTIQETFTENERDLLEQLNQLLENEELYKIGEKRLNLFAENGVNKIIDNLDQWLGKK